MTAMLPSPLPKSVAKQLLKSTLDQNMAGSMKMLSCHVTVVHFAASRNRLTSRSVPFKQKQVACRSMLQTSALLGAAQFLCVCVSEGA